MSVAMDQVMSSNRRLSSQYLVCVFLLLLGVSAADATTNFDVVRDSQNARSGSEHGARRVLRVGSDKAFALPSAAARIANDGDIIEIDAGVYEKDAAVWRQHNLLIRGTGGKAHIRANGVAAEGKALWVIKGNNTVIENIEFSGARVPHRNGAGIRQEGAGLTIRDCYFHDNENGILTGVSAESDIVIEHSEFARNGYGDGYSHNIYVGGVRSFTLRFSYIHRALVGHNVKSRAASNYLFYNRIMDEDDGKSSYAIDLPNGGLALIVGNLVQHGPRAQNWTLISYGAEGLSHPLNKLRLVNNTLVNEVGRKGRFLFVATGVQEAMAINNIFAGLGITSSGHLALQRNLVTDKSAFVDAAKFDYRLKARSRAVGTGEDPNESGGFNMSLQGEYGHPAGVKPRAAWTTRDIGTHVYRSGYAK
jgi:hypothetical protein